MTAWIALLRGINVGGSHLVPMKKLRKLLEDAGFSDVETYIQSGNCVFHSQIEDRAAIADMVSGLIEGEFGFRPSTFALTKGDLDEAIAANPFPADGGKSVHFMFMKEPPAGADLDGLRNHATPTEDFALIGRVLYLHAPDGIGRSKLAERIGRYVKADMTARNLNSVYKLAEMARDITG